MEYKIKARDRQRKCRAKKKVRQERSNTTKATSPIPFSTPLPNINPCNTTQSYGKAVARSRKALPMSPPKKLAVAADLAIDVALSLEMKKLRSSSEEARYAVREFFFRPGISYIMLGLNELIAVWDDSRKKKLRKYYLAMFLRETHKVYCQTHDMYYVLLTFIANIHGLFL